MRSLLTTDGFLLDTIHKGLLFVGTLVGADPWAADNWYGFSRDTWTDSRVVKTLINLSFSPYPVVAAAAAGALVTAMRTCADAKDLDLLGELQEAVQMIRWKSMGPMGPGSLDVANVLRGPYSGGCFYFPVAEPTMSLDVRDPARRVPHLRGVLRAVFDTRQPIAYVTSGAQDFALCEEPVLWKRFESYRRPSLLRGKGPSVLAALYTATVAMDPSLRTLFWRYFWTFPPELQGDLVAAIRKDVTTVAGLRKSLPRRLAALVLLAEEAHIASTKDAFVCRSHFRLRDALATRSDLDTETLVAAQDQAVTIAASLPKPWPKQETEVVPAMSASHIHPRTSRRSSPTHTRSSRTHTRFSRTHTQFSRTSRRKHWASGLVCLSWDLGIS